ncbi:hypothetical protein [Virgibacillus salexigens]|uniref:Uncharacterized protein n=1 Tax=Virgibacillus massiliensis TaxID=1462526 RepID=A0A024QHU0_9BACI|nr:hypothetical protein [Virgibacillus massiliensis]CDQ41486.1 hypothetical protein BN990_03859 [Virgibacillus massiliensis]
MIPAIAFKNKNKIDRYLSNGLDAGDWSDEDLEVAHESLEDAFLIIREDHSVPTDEDVEALIEESKAYKKFMIDKFGDNLISFDVEKWLEHYEPVLVELTEEQYTASKEWD